VYKQLSLVSGYTTDLPVEVINHRLIVIAGTGPYIQLTVRCIEQYRHSGWPIL